MGGSMGGIFSGQGQGAADPNAPPGAATPPSFLQSLVQGTAKGAGQGFGASTQQRQPQQGGGLPGAPGATPVDPRYFAQSQFNQQPQQQQNPGAQLYGG